MKLTGLAQAEVIKIGVAVALIAGLVWYVKKKGVATVTSAAVGVVGDAVGGAVLGVGDVLGVPRTNETECQKAIREGRTWDASFACPAGTFIGSIFGGGGNDAGHGASGSW